MEHKKSRSEKLERRIANNSRLQLRADRMSEKYFKQRMAMLKLLAKYKVTDNLVKE